MSNFSRSSGHHHRGRGRGQTSRQNRGEREHNEYSSSDFHCSTRSSRGRGSFGSQRQGAIKYLSPADIKLLVQSSSSEVLACVNDNEAGFLAAYRHDRYCMDPLMMKRLVKLLYLLVKMDEFDRIASRTLARILSADGNYALFIMKLDFLIKGMIDETRGFVIDENPQYLNYLIEIGKKAIMVIPETVLNTYPLLVIQKTIHELIKKGSNLDTLEQKVKSLDLSFKMARDERSKQRTHTPESTGSSGVSEPSEHFRDVDILPSLTEVHSSDDQIYLRPNILKGAYGSWDHYLDVQYRLLREDFVRPLRHGIQHYCTPGLGKQSQDIRVYDNVNILSPVCLLTGMGFEIQFDTAKFARVNWEHSRRLIFGSLLCLSKDKFEHSIIFASVVKRDLSLLKDGYLTVKFEGNLGGFQLNPNEVYTMVESTAYFEAYRHILLKLQEMSSYSEEIPFKEYIVGCKLSDIPAPSYSQRRRQLKFDLTEILGVASQIVIQDQSSWPLAEATSLDQSQLEALKMALTKEISVIQGPPGTGKTFIGLKIVESFLRNRPIWDRNREAPILVVCYTNHALDQFLEGIQSMCIDSRTPSIVRIGGRCKSERLSTSILRNKVRECQSGNELPRVLLRRLGESRGMMFKCKDYIDTMSDSVSTSGDNRLVSLTELKNVIATPHYHQLTEGIHEGSGKELEIWLDLWHPDLYKNIDSQDNETDIVGDEITPVEEASGLDDNCIEIDNEAKLMEDDRILEGEQIELLGISATQESAHSELTPQPTSVGGWQTVRINETSRARMINKGLKCEPLSAEKVSSVRDIWILPLDKKWQLYTHWIKEYTKYSLDQSRNLAERYDQACEKYVDSLKEIDEHVIRGSDVIGITTTGAAKHHHILKKIHPKLVIFEEAAEIFEAHVATSLAPSVQQLVLIGDHKQLQPKPNCYDLDVQYQLSVSLFERLIRNKIPYVTLNVQHRMRPEISSLIHPSIYSDLRDHVTVTEYDHILGVAKDVFVIDHNQPERANKQGDITTHVNVFESDYLIGFCRYLLNQGYHPRNITILSMYRGQLLELRRKMHRRDFEGVRLAAVDDFQGEENDIILLSLVRSNPEKNIGFLNNSNRVCVSLSRAKKGLYIIGNLSMLRGKDKTIWPEIISDLEEHQCIGKALPLYCRVHGGDNFVEEPDDFRKCPEGGCDQPCKARLPCGHSCPRICHPNDMDHTKSKCLRDCPKSLPCGHKCMKRCHQCTSGCGPCSTMVSRVLPVCAHEIIMQCSHDAACLSCPRLCGKLLKCGHTCQNTCSKPCNLKCSVEVEKSLQCGHLVKELCFRFTSKIECPEKCKALLECEHQCVGTCGECFKGRMHVLCRQKCDRQLVCGHTCGFPCASICPPCTKLCNNFCVHSQCPKKCYEICDPCMEPCQWQCKHFKCTRPCGLLCNRPCCNEPCMKTLKCGHLCIGLCGERCPALCRVCNKDRVNDVFFGTEDDEDARFVVLEDCDHFFEVTSLDRWFHDDTSEGAEEVSFKACPRCRTPIRKSLRYSNQVKKTLKDIEQIKQKQLIPRNDLVQKVKGLRQLTRRSQGFLVIRNEVEYLEDVSKQENLHPYRANAFFVQTAVLASILNVVEITEAVRSQTAAKLKSQLASCYPEHVLKSLEEVKTFVMQDFLSPQQVSDITCELRRIACAAKLCDFVCKIHEEKCQFAPEDDRKVAEVVRQISDCGWKVDKLTEEGEESVLSLIKSLCKSYNIDVLSQKEKMDIVKAVGLAKGHWYKCPNGHYYCIGQCGGATETSKCPDCGVIIGGAQHTLASGNVHAPEMDGSSYAAWSEGANMANYDPNQFQ